MRNVTFIIFSFLLCLVAISCSGSVKNIAGSLEAPSSRVLLYMHNVSPVPPDIKFTISNISFESAGKKWITVMDNRIVLDSSSLSSGQVLLKDASINPGRYRRVKIRLLDASIMTGGNRASLALPQPDGEMIFEKEINLKVNESSVVSLRWEPDTSFKKNVTFQPDIRVETQEPSTRGLLLIISNKGSNYLTVMDRAIERVIGAITVGEKPAGMAINSFQDRLFVVNTGSRNISVVDPTAMSVIDSIPLSSGIGPSEVVFLPDLRDPVHGKLYVTNSVSNDVSVISTLAGKIVKSIPVDMSPSAIAVDVKRREIYVACSKSNTLIIINTVNDSVVKRIPVESRPSGLLLGKDIHGHSVLYVLNEGSHSLSIISQIDRRVLSVIPLSFSPTGGTQGGNGKFYISSSSSNKLIILSPGNSVTRTIDAGPGPRYFAVDVPRNRFYLTNMDSDTLSIFDHLGERILKEIPVGRNPYSVLVIER